MRAYTQTRKEHRKFVESLIKVYEVVAPRKTDAVRYEKITSADQINLDEQSYTPIKEYFFPPKQTLFNFTGTKFTATVPKVVSRVFYGVRRCDLNGIMKQDKVFVGDAGDPYYKAAREKSYLLGYHCNTAPSENCFCKDMDLKDYFDLMFFDKGDHFLVEIGSEKGRELLENFKKHFKKSTRHITQDDKKIIGANKLKRKDITTLYDHPDWKKGVDQCVSCGACTSLCPTCYCFSIHDETNASNVDTGTRNREWSSCQLQGFTKVAGDHVFRKDREERFKHRIYHQLQYFKEKYGEDLCVGCGRCITSCPTRIDWVNIVNEMKE